MTVMTVRMVAIFQYTDHVGCSCSAPRACSTASTDASVPCEESADIMSRLSDQVDEREDRDPDDIDEVPIQGHDVDVQGVLGAEPALEIDRQHREQPDDAGRHVRAVEAGQRKEGRSKQVRADAQPLMDERGELKRLESQ